jgi:hypothetical protein
MSNTRKHQSYAWKKKNEPQFDDLHYRVKATIWNSYREEWRTRTFFLKKPGVIHKKKRRDFDTTDHWYKTTPSGWTRRYMTRPQRRAGSLWERDVVRTSIDELDGVDHPLVGRKPHVYYW